MNDTRMQQIARIEISRRNALDELAELNNRRVNALDWAVNTLESIRGEQHFAAAENTKTLTSTRRGKSRGSLQEARFYHNIDEVMLEPLRGLRSQLKAVRIVYFEAPDLYELQVRQVNRTYDARIAELDMYDEDMYDEGGSPEKDCPTEEGEL